VKVKALFWIWLTAWLALTAIGVLVVPRASTPEVTLSGGALFALPSSLAPLLLAALTLLASRKRPDQGVPIAAALAAIVTVGMGGTILHDAPSIMVVTGSAPLPLPRERAEALNGAMIAGVISLVLATFDALLYFTLPMRGARRLAVVVGLIGAGAAAWWLADTINTWTDELTLEVGAFGLMSGLGLMFALLALTAGYRWVRDGFRADRAATTPQPLEANP
jgi:hypothetical protein